MVKNWGLPTPAIWTTCLRSRSFCHSSLGMTHSSSQNLDWKSSSQLSHSPSLTPKDHEMIKFSVTLINLFFNRLSKSSFNVIKKNSRKSYSDCLDFPLPHDLYSPSPTVSILPPKWSGCQNWWTFISALLPADPSFHWDLLWPCAVSRLLTVCPSPQCHTESTKSPSVFSLLSPKLLHITATLLITVTNHLAVSGLRKEGYLWAHSLRTQSSGPERQDLEAVVTSHAQWGQRGDDQAQLTFSCVYSTGPQPQNAVTHV